MQETFTNSVEAAHPEKSNEFKNLEKRYIKLLEKHSLLDQKSAQATGEERKKIIKEMRDTMKEITKIEEFMKLDVRYKELKDLISDLEEKSTLTEGKMREDLMKNLEKTMKEIEEIEQKMKELMPYNFEGEQITRDTQKDLKLLRNGNKNETDNYDATRIV